jgi:hypothetical protein
MAEVQGIKGDDLQAKLDRARSRLTEFEQIINEAVSGSYYPYHPPEFAENLMRDDPVLSWRLVDLFDAYLDAGAYPIDRLPGVADRALDAKLEYYFVAKAMPGLHNWAVSNQGFELSLNPWMGR